MAENNNKALEERFAELQQIIEKLEQGTLPLDESIAAYARGMQLSASCRKTLDEMNEKVKKARELLDEGRGQGQLPEGAAGPGTEF
ncbi:MAG: exodeoxyribonuclease VII small subunit [Proteobacteria bacterium]|uniref:Exodeoxyribonuclease 7 small subunit n=1 Tax=Candidatus Avisuccinivibrio stercorigallinarum TaxID=2840704 RepID=A0A9D9GTC3_9GAMM|nr:exodeoxyribonuclease VII small subunit [Candidatus Avisuccinivibrio stercorigallinarum]